MLNPPPCNKPTGKSLLFGCRAASEDRLGHLRKRRFGWISRFGWCGLAHLFCLWPGHPGAIASETNLLDSWLQAQTNLQTWTADVIQIRSLTTLAEPLRAEGHVWFAAPNRFRWEIGRPPRTIAVRQPEEMLVIYPKLQRVERYRWKGNQQDPLREMLALLEAGFPQTQSELDRRFQVLEQKVSAGNGTLLLQPRARSARRMMPRITVEFTLTNTMLRAMELQFMDGSILRNEFRNPARNTPLPDALFSPPLDPNYNVVDPLGHSP